MKAMLLAGLAALAIGTPIAASAAATVYTYTGPTYTNNNDEIDISGSYTLDMRIAGTLTLAAPLAPNLPAVRDFNDASLISPVSFSFSDGRVTVTDQTVSPLGSINTNNSFFYFSTDATGQITEWWVQLRLADPAPYFRTQMTSASDPFFKGDDAHVALEVFPFVLMDNAFTVNVGAGSWTVSAVPEPATYTMLLAGLALIAPAVRRFRA